MGPPGPFIFVLCEWGEDDAGADRVDSCGSGELCERGGSWRHRRRTGRGGGGGAPTFVGTLAGNSFVNATLFVAFLALAAGSMLYVVVQLIKVANRHGRADVVMWGVFTGLSAGFATDYVLVAAGG